ncbi:MAG: phosphoenolpyruvate carboxylase, partial [Kofleriaceae bacterium]
MTAALDAAVAHIGGDHTRQLCRRIGDAAHALRAGTLPGGREEFAAAVRSLEDGELEDLARTFALQCHLMNVAEERARLRALRSRNDQPRDGVVVAIDRLIEGGATEVDLQALFERALIMPVLTAHPSEARRRSTLDHLMRIERLLEQHDDGRDPGPGAGSVTQSVIEQALDAEVLAFLATDDARARPPTPLDEVESVLEMFRRSLLDVTPRIYRTIEDRLGARFGHRWRLPSFVRWGSWVGGDRDGNPNVTAALTRTVFSRHRAAALGRYLEDVVLLGRTLSMSTVRVAKPLEELEANLERDRERLPEVAARARPRTIHEPWREKLWYVQARLRATLEQRDDSYATAAEYRDDLAVLERSLLAADLAQIADQELRDALRRVDVFGFHLASLDIRQHSAVHDRVVDELFARGGRAGYLALDERGRRSWLCEALDHPLPPERERNGLSADAAEVLATLEVIGRARHELGASACERYVVSFTREVSDLLEVVFLARAAGLAPGDVRPVPLLEQLEDLERAGTIARDILGLPALRRELGRTTELEVMIGYSDSGKQVGYLASSISLRHAQLALVDATRDSGATLTLFHGRGGALGRGGGPESDAIRSQPAGAIRGRLRVTEQGETVNARYAHPEIAERDLELTIAAVLSATLSEHDIDPVDREPAIQSAADAARARYRTLTEDEQRLVRYVVAATPIE